MKANKLKGEHLILGQKVFWRWKNSGKGYTEEVVIETNGDMIALGSSEYSNVTSWINLKDIDLIVKDMSKEKP